MSDEKNPYLSDYSPSPSAAAPKKQNKQEAATQVNFDVKGTYGTPAALLDNLEKVESSGQATALNPNSKALGAYQFTPETTKHLHDIGVKFNPFDKAESRAAADYYLSTLLSKNNGDWNKALAAYGGFKTENPLGYIASVTKDVDFGKNATPVASAAAPAPSGDAGSARPSEPDSKPNPYAEDYPTVRQNSGTTAAMAGGFGTPSNRPGDFGPHNVRTFGSPKLDAATFLAEMGSNAPSGSVAQLNEFLKTPPSKVSPEYIAKSMAEKRTPAVEMPSPPVEEPIPVEPTPRTSGGRWLSNWANDPDAANFEGGVPEGAKKYQSGKPQGKIVSRLDKRGLLNVNKTPGSSVYFPGEQSAATAAKEAASETARIAAEDDALTRTRKALYEKEMYQKSVEKAKAASAAREAQVAQEGANTVKAARISAPLSYLNNFLHYGGLGISAYDIARRLGVFNAEDTDLTGAAISGGGALAQMAAPYVPAVAGTIAGPLAAAALPVIATAAPLYNMARDRIEYLRQHPEQQEIFEDKFDVMNNPLR